MSDPELAIRCQGLVKRFRDLTAVDGIDLDVVRGECFGLLGPNGAGKTTTIEILEGLLPQDEGVVEVLGGSWGDGHDRARRSRMGVSLQQAYLGEHVTVRETVEMFRSFHARGRSVDETLALLGLAGSERRRVGKLSGGQRQRLALAAALVGDPELLFLDEPTTGLDPQARNRLWTVIEEFRAKGGTVLLTTHFMDEATRLCDRLAIMDEGHVIARGSPAELIASLHAQQLVEVEAEQALEDSWLAGLPGVTEVRERGRARVLAVDDVRLALPALLEGVARHGASLERVATHLPTLDDVFLHLTGKELRDG